MPDKYQQTLLIFILQSTNLPFWVRATLISASQRVNHVKDKYVHIYLLVVIPTS